MGTASKTSIRRKQVREQRAKQTGPARVRWFSYVTSWSVLASAVLVIAASAVALLGDATIDFAIGQRLERAIYAKVDFQVPDPERTSAAREGARAKTPSHYTLAPPAVTFDRIRADLMRLYQAAADADTLDSYGETLKGLGWPVEEGAYNRLRRLVDMPEDAGRAQLQEWINKLPLESQYVVQSLLREPRDPLSATDYIVLDAPGPDGGSTAARIPHAELVSQGSDKALRGSAAEVARKLPAYELRSTVESIVVAAFREQPTIVYSQERTVEAMRDAESATPPAMAAYERGKPFISPGVLSSADYALLTAHRAAYLKFLTLDLPEAGRLKRERWLQQAGLVTMVVLISIGLMVFARIQYPRLFEVRLRTLAFVSVILGTLVTGRVLDMRWPQYPELVLAPCLLSAYVLAIAYSRRFAIGAVSVVALLVTTVIHGHLTLLLTLFGGVVIAAFQLNEIRTRTKLIASGVVSAFAIMIVSTAGGFMEGHEPSFIFLHVGWAAACALLASFAISGVLPFMERFFGIATSLTLLEWRDPTRPLLQLLAREAPGTYNHSLVLGTLAEAACERIEANGLLAQVGALYHDIGKIHKADYFAENQEGRPSRHENLAPTMSLLIILGHVKDGVEMAREYKLPSVLRQFIEEHHGTTVVRYFHSVASEKQPRIASGKHDREVPEAVFRYAGPKPRSRETAVLMLCDGVEGAVRALPEPTAGRIESVVHQIVMDRLNDGQFDDCDITLKQISQVEESLVKSLCGIYHGRVAYPKAQKPREEPVETRRISG